MFSPVCVILSTGEGVVFVLSGGGGGGGGGGTSCPGPVWGRARSGLEGEGKGRGRERMGREGTLTK